jgi:hypothetical protein
MLCCVYGTAEAMPFQNIGLVKDFLIVLLSAATRNSASLGSLDNAKIFSAEPNPRLQRNSRSAAHLQEGAIAGGEILQYIVFTAPVQPGMSPAHEAVVGKDKVPG